eukprot:scaffold189_cov118-Isochrysis_galbana.AAC.17
MVPDASPTKSWRSSLPCSPGVGSPAASNTPAQSNSVPDGRISTRWSGKQARLRSRDPAETGSVVRIGCHACTLASNSSSPKSLKLARLTDGATTQVEPNGRCALSVATSHSAAQVAHHKPQQPRRPSPRRAIACLRSLLASRRVLRACSFSAELRGIASLCIPSSHTLAIACRLLESARPVPSLDPDMDARRRAAALDERAERHTEHAALRLAEACVPSRTAHAVGVKQQ